MRQEFSKAIKLQAWERCKGHCERCTAKLFPGRFDYDHVKPDALGGDNSLANCQVLCEACHDKKTITEDRPIIDKASRVRAKWLGLKAKPKGNNRLRGRGFPKRKSE